LKLRASFSHLRPLLPRHRRNCGVPTQVLAKNFMTRLLVSSSRPPRSHLNANDRTRLFAHLDSLLDAESWVEADAITTEASFTTLLRMILFLKGRRPGLGATSTGNFIATWTEGTNRLTVECKPDGQVRWVLVHDLDGQRESAAGDTTVRRLPEVLHPYDPPKRWFPNANKTPA
jgi:hypothetical protein